MSDGPIEFPAPRTREDFILRCSLLIVLGLMCSGVNPACADETGVSPKRAESQLFPAELEVWKDSQPELADGIVQAEKLRTRLLSNSSSEKTYAEMVCEFVTDFEKSTQPAGDEPSVGFRESIGRFSMTGPRLLNQLRGGEVLPLDAFGAFDGKWFGRWDQTPVNHDWRPSVSFQPPKTIAPGQSPISALQYAWISNGFGWNYLSSVDARGDRNYVLGMVYYFDHPNYRDIVETKPHVGFADSPTRLVWITEREVYLEETFLETMTGQPDHYVITGLRHNVFGETPTVSSNAVQATYTRDPNNRPAFQKLKWSPTLREVQSDE